MSEELRRELVNFEMYLRRGQMFRAANLLADILKRYEPPNPEQQVIDSEGLTERYRRAEGQ